MISELAQNCGFEIIRITSDSELQHKLFERRKDDLEIMHGCVVNHLPALLLHLAVPHSDVGPGKVWDQTGRKYTED